MRTKLLAVFGLLVLSAVATVAGARGAASSAPPPGSGSSAAAALQEASPLCRFTHDKTAFPARVPLGDAVTVTLSVSALCTALDYPLHVVVAIDQSTAMRGAPLEAAVSDARALVRLLAIGDRRTNHMAVVAFDERPFLRTALTSDGERVHLALDRVAPRDRPAEPASGLQQGGRALANGVQQHDPKYTADVLVLYSVGAQPDACAAGAIAAGELRASGVLVVAVCAAGDCDRDCLGGIASSPRYLFDVGDEAMSSAFRQIQDRKLNTVVREVAISDTLGSDVELVPDSAMPAPDAIDPAGRWLSWQEVYIPRGGFTVTYQVRPQRIGDVATNREAVGSGKDNWGGAYSWHFAMPTVRVVTPAPTPTRRPPTATATPRPTKAATPTPTAAAHRRQLWVPYGLR